MRACFKIQYPTFVSGCQLVDTLRGVSIDTQQYMQICGYIKMDKKMKYTKLGTTC